MKCYFANYYSSSLRVGNISIHLATLIERQQVLNLLREIGNLHLHDVTPVNGIGVAPDMLKFYVTAT
jgi:hypothetical protein